MNTAKRRLLRIGDITLTSLALLFALVGFLFANDLCTGDSVSARSCSTDEYAWWADLGLLLFLIAFLVRWVLRRRNWRLPFLVAMAGWYWTWLQSNKVEHYSGEPAAVVTHGLLPALALLAAVYAGQALYARHGQHARQALAARYARHRHG